MIFRRLKKIIVLIFLIPLIYFFVRFGFEQEVSHSEFGEHLDRNHIEISKLDKRNRKFRESNEIIGESAIWNSIVNKQTTENHEDSILRAFMEKVHQTKPVNNVNTDEEVEAKTERKIKLKRKKNRKKRKKQKNVNVVMKVDSKDVKSLEDIKKILVSKNLTDVNAKVKIKTFETTTKESPPVLMEIEPPQPSNEKEKLGDYGKAVTLPPDIPDNIKQLVDDGWKNHQFNEYISNLISVKRNLLDFRSDYCHEIHKSYKKDLPPVSVIIVFYNEAWSTLLRTIHSVIDRSPDKLIREILLVDDYSDMPHLKSQLDEYVKGLDKVRVLRNAKREGLIRTRNRGAIHAKSDILVFLDSHIETTTGWLEPLVDRIARNKTNIAVPVIEQIHDDTFELTPRDRSHSISLGGFAWNLQFRWFYMKSSDRKHPDAPISTPTMAGGLFAISAAYFKHVGMYDPGLELWGGENLELSFKTWMCGGHIQMIPCSHIGHVFRKKSPYEWSHDVDIFKKNSMRVAKVWMDDYVKFFEKATGYENISYGDISERVKLRKSLNCESFSWYLKNVYPERSIPSEQIAYGQIQNLGYNQSMCLDGEANKFSSLINVFKCHGEN